jgi:hypothetical protein
MKRSGASRVDDVNVQVTASVPATPAVPTFTDDSGHDIPSGSTTNDNHPHISGTGTAGDANHLKLSLTDVLNLGDQDLFHKDGHQQLMVKGADGARWTCRTRTSRAWLTAVAGRRYGGGGRCDVQRVRALGRAHRTAGPARRAGGAA